MSSKLPIVYCALDTKDIGRARELSMGMTEAGCGVKLGLEFFNAHGPQGVHDILTQRVRPSLFLDLKFHDIPNTVGEAVASAASLDVAFLNVHASGGLSMMGVAKSKCNPATRLLAVTVLTSLNDSAMLEVGQPAPVMDQVTRLARLTKQAGLDGVVCSPLEIASVREACGPDFILMIPGVRPEGSRADDQARTMTPRAALDAGATHLVIGRPITQAPNPVQAAKDIIDSLQ